jgi:hypothetical protein
LPGEAEENNEIISWCQEQVRAEHLPNAIPERYRHVHLICMVLSVIIPDERTRFNLLVHAVLDNPVL